MIEYKKISETEFYDKLDKLLAIVEGEKPKDCRYGAVLAAQFYKTGAWKNATRHIPTVRKLAFMIP